MPRFRYVGDHERIHPGPPVWVLSPGDVVDAAVNPDPALFEPLPADAASPPADHSHGPAADRVSGLDEGPDGDAGGEPR